MHEVKPMIIPISQGQKLSSDTIKQLPKLTHHMKHWGSELRLFYLQKLKFLQAKK